MLAYSNRKRRRHVTLMEVLIAFVLVTFCLIPLLSPHVAILKEQHQFLRKIQLDHAVNLYTGHVVEKLHRSEIPWYMIEESKTMPIEDELLRQFNLDQPLAFKGIYRFDVIKSKPKNAESGAPKAYLLKLNFYFLPGKGEHSVAEFTDKKNPNQYAVDLFVRRL